jgi:predicted nucleotide-binding protein
VERAAHRNEDSLSATEVAAHWHDHFKADVSANDKILNDQAVCFFQLTAAAELGNIVVGRKGAPTRFAFDANAVSQFIVSEGAIEETNDEKDGGGHERETEEKQPKSTPAAPTIPPTPAAPALGQGIFIAHGKNKKPLEQLKKILDQFKIPYKVAVDEPNLGRPIGSKIRDIMQACNCAILIFTADEQFQDKDGNTIWRPSENVTYELGASGYLYDNRIVIMKEDEVVFPTNFRDLGYISFEKDQLDAKVMDVLKELIGFGIVKVST